SRVQVRRLKRKFQMGEQLASKNQAAVHHTKHHWICLSHFGRDLRANAGDCHFNFSFGVQAVSLSHDLTDMLEISRHDALQGGLHKKSGQRYASAWLRSSIYGLTFANVCRTSPRIRLI